MRRPTADRPPVAPPEREALARFCAGTRPWALREARRAYRHLPARLREDAVDRALRELGASVPDRVDRRALMADLAARLDAALRQAHSRWCLDEASARLRREGVVESSPAVARDGLADFVESGLGGLERAVLALEIGAGRDSRTTRAALRLGPREYGRHRESGLSKLRDAIGARVAGHVCADHLPSVVRAATGDRAAQQQLHSGQERCRACAREAQGLRTVLDARLAVAPWPLAIKPAGLLAAKLGGVAALAGGGGAATTAGGGGGLAATVVAVAALATGTTAVLATDPPAERRADPAPAGAPAAARQDAAARPRTRVARTRTATRTRRGTRRPAPAAARRLARQPQTTAPAPRPAATTAPPATGPAAAAPTAAPADVTPESATVGAAVEQVGGTVRQVTGTLPAGVRAPVDQALDTARDATEPVTGAVDELLTPQP